MIRSSATSPPIVRGRPFVCSVTVVPRSLSSFPDADRQLPVDERRA